jgi:hypothetical protein
MPKIGNFSDEQGLQNNFNRKYLYNSKMVVKLRDFFRGTIKKNGASPWAFCGVKKY